VEAVYNSSSYADIIILPLRASEDIVASIVLMVFEGGNNFDEIFSKSGVNVCLKNR
jgi:hypothetical protein